MDFEQTIEEMLAETKRQLDRTKEVYDRLSGRYATLLEIRDKLRSPEPEEEVETDDEDDSPL